MLGVLAFVLATLPPFPAPDPRDTVIHVILKDNGRLHFNTTAIAAADTSHFYEIGIESATCRVMQEEQEVDEPQLLGTGWAEIGFSRPTSGTEIQSEALAAELQHQVTFTPDEFEQLGLSDDLSPDNFVKARNFKYYRPLAQNELMYISVAGPFKLITPVSRTAQENISQSVDGSLSVNFRAASRIAKSKENAKLLARCLITMNVKLYRFITFVHVQGLDKEFGFHDVQQAALDTVEHTNFDSVKEMVMDLVNSVSVQPKPLDHGPSRRDQRDDEAYMGIYFQPLLPYIYDSSGVIKALYIHVEAGASLNMTAAFIGLATNRSDIGIDHKNALIEAASFPFSWLLVVGKDTKPTVVNDRTRGRFFTTCARGCGMHTLRSITVTVMKAWMTHQIREIEISAAATPSSSHFFKTLVGDDHAVVRVNLVPERGRRAFAYDKDMCIQMDLIAWRLEGCFQVKKNPSNDNLIPMSLPSVHLTLANREYFENISRWREGEVLLYGFANLTQFERSTPDRARTVVGLDARHPADSEGQLMHIGAPKLQSALVASGDMTLDVFDLKLNTTLKVDFGIIEEDLPVERDEHDAIFYVAALQLLNNKEGNVLLELNNFAVG